ncbi:MAG: hypothetical protein F6K30_30115, partial [Cyanothece sp. SIO2G6]|nr:hypothetical protein [Cyanothece sp. SIO2G6]
ANVQAANLSRADLSLANLSYANFDSTNLTGALMRAAQVISTSFNRANLTGACIENLCVGGKTTLGKASCEYVYLKANWSTQYKRFVFLNRYVHKRKNRAKICA